MGDIGSLKPVSLVFRLKPKMERRRLAAKWLMK